MQHPGFNPASVAVTTDASVAGAYPGAATAVIAWVRDEPERLEFAVSCVDRAFVVVADSYFKGWTARLRSNSMNALFGLSDNTGGSANGHAWLDAQWRQYLKLTQVPQPSFTWLTLDEHPDGINDAFFVAGYNAAQWGDLPASYHNGACGFSFADGHAEVHKWLSRTSVYPVKFSFGVVPFDAPGKLDFQWYQDRTGYTKY